MENIYRESTKWNRFARTHQTKWTVLASYIVAYFATLGICFYAQSAEWLFFGGLFGAGLNLVICLGGQVVFIFMAIMLFDSSYRIWVDELNKLFGGTVRPRRWHFYSFILGKKPVEELIRVHDLQIEKQRLEEHRESAVRNLHDEEAKLEVIELKIALYDLKDKFHSGSREAQRLERALRRGTNAHALQDLLDQLTSAQPSAEPVSKAPNRDKIAELEATFSAEEAEGTDSDAKQLFLAAQTEQNRKTKRKLLVEAIATLRAANKKRREQEERSRRFRHSSASS